jgi:hypothetical protein
MSHFRPAFTLGCEPVRPRFPARLRHKTELASPAGIVLFKENHMADNKNPNEKQPGEKPEGKHHYNPGNQSGKEAEIVPKEDAHKEKEPGRP